MWKFFLISFAFAIAIADSHYQFGEIIKSSPCENNDHKMRNIGYLFRGYDIYFGNPITTHNVVDSGYQASIFEAVYEGGTTTDDSRYCIPGTFIL